MRLTIFFIFIGSFFTIDAQNLNNNAPGKIAGKVIDSLTAQPIEYATITVLQEGNSKPYNGTVTNNSGHFELDNVEPGNYELVVGFIGYQSRTLSFSITKQNPFVSFKSIQLTNSNNVMSGVTVTASRPLIENKIDKLVYNVDKDISSQGGVAADVLKKIPQVTVDIDGNVELQGSSSIRFLIDGKPSSIFGNSLADALQSIPASQIQSIEVITSPGAKYDAQGTGGIINIILKKSNIRGINGNINLTAGTRLENGSFNLNFRHDNFGMHAYFSGNGQRPSVTINQQNRVSFDSSGKTTQFLQDGTSEFTRNGFQTGFGFDWSITKKDNITGGVSYNHFGNHNNGFTNQESIYDSAGSQISDIKSIRSGESRFNFHSIDWNLNYKKTFKKDKQELDINYNTSFGSNTSYYLQSQTYMGQTMPFTGSTSNNPGKDNETNLAIDYTHPLSEKSEIETGVKYVENNINSIANVYTLQAGSYQLDPSQSYIVNYKRKVYSYYLSGSFSLGQFLDVRAGGRYEYTDTKADFSNAKNVSIPSYNTFAPSLILSHAFSNNESLKLSYSYRIERPDYRDLNPFMNLSDPHNIQTGNPLLLPEIGNNFELGYNKSFDKGANLNIAAFHRRNTHDIKNYTTYYPFYQIGDSVYQNVSLSTRENIGMENRTGVNISLSIPVVNSFNIRSNIMMANRQIINNFLGGVTTNGFEYRVNLNGSYQFKNDIALEIFGNYNSSVRNIQGRQPSFMWYNMAIRKQFMHKNASIAFTTANPFNKYITQETQLIGPNFTSYSYRKIPLRSFGLSFTYKFGKLEFKKPKEEENNNNIDAPAGN